MMSKLLRTSGQIFLALLAAAGGTGCAAEIGVETEESVTATAQALMCAEPVSQEDRVAEGRWMDSTVDYDARTGLAYVTTTVSNSRFATGWTGGVAVAFVDKDGLPIHFSETHTRGVNACPWSCPKRSTMTWPEAVPANLRGSVAGVAILHAHTPSHRAAIAVLKILAGTDPACVTAPLPWNLACKRAAARAKDRVAELSSVTPAGFDELVAAVHSGGVHMFPTCSGTPRQNTPEELYISSSNRLWAVDAGTGAGSTVNDDDQANPVAMAAASGDVFEIFGSPSKRLYKIGLVTGGYVDVTPGLTWDGTEAMTALGNYLYIVSASTMWRVDKRTGEAAPFGDYAPYWAGTVAMAAVGDGVYAVQADTLYKLNVNNGSVSLFGEDPTTWAGTESMAATGDGVYAVTQGAFWKVNINNGRVNWMGNDWAGTPAMTAKNGYVYAASVGWLWRVNTSNGDTIQLGSLPWDGTRAMAVR
jgi:hypothetical protein